MSTHKEATVMKTCQADGREVRGNVSEADKPTEEVTEPGILELWSDPRRERSSCPVKVKLFFGKCQRKWQIS
jgi:hypothetical protein